MELSSKQLEIVNSTARNIIVCAGAGSGKTRVLTERVKRLLEGGEEPTSIVVITFTTYAADELKQRLNGTVHANKCFIGTIHAYANKLLKKTGYKFDIFSEDYQNKFMKILIPKYAIYCSIADYEKYVKLQRRLALGKIRESDIRSKFDSRVYNEIIELLGFEYTTKPETVVTMCRQNNIISFDELLKLTTEYFSKSNTKIKHLFVDEFQDIDYLEYNFIMKLNSDNNFFIGDDYQSIYGFKGGDVQIFLNLTNSPDWTTYMLIENYRTAKSILFYANGIIKKANDIIPKEVECLSGELGKLEFKSKSQIYDFLQQINNGDSWFILTRTNKELSTIESMLYKQSIPYHVFKRSEMTKKEIDDAVRSTGIKVMTVHAAKGLECDNVAIYGKFPTRKFDNSDELKVFYVALTRARYKCVVFA